MNHTDNTLIKLFLPIIQAGLIKDGFVTSTVKQMNQPTIQGANTKPTVYFQKIYNRRYGYMRREETWDPVAEDFIHTETQQYECAFQVIAQVTQNPSDLTIPTASDLVNAVAWILQASSTLDTLNAKGVGVLRITDVSNPYYTDDRDNFSASPTFDFVLVYSNTRVSVTPKITPPIVPGIYGV